MRKYLLLGIILLAAILRFYKLDSVPPSLYWDEASLGYNAYSILTTGRDEHGKFLPTTNFAAFGDYKPPGYIYAAVPSIAVFGLTEFAIRFPSALFGTLTVLLTYLLTKKLFNNTGNPAANQKHDPSTSLRTRGGSRRGIPDSAQSTKGNQSFVSSIKSMSTGGPPKASLAFSGEETTDRTPKKANDQAFFAWQAPPKPATSNQQPATIALLAAFFLAISPWHLQFSRAAFEANLGLFFSTLGIYLFVKFAKDKKIWILPSLLSFLAGMYTFTGQRLFVPFILMILLIQFKKQILENLKFVLLAFIIFGFLFWPLYKFATQTLEGRLRFEEVTIFRDLDPVNQSISYRQKDNFTWFSDIIHNRRLQYSYQYLIHYFDAFNPSFLFSRGDVNPRLSVREVGELYLIDLPLILAGIYFLFSKKQKFRFLIISWLLVSPLGPAIARETPHALRMIHILPTFQLIAAFGLFNLYQSLRSAKFSVRHTFFLPTIASAAVAFLILNFLFYLHMYYFHWPKNYSREWQYGYKQAVEKVNTLYSDVDSVVVTKKYGRPYIYFLLYSKYDPQKFWQSGSVTQDKFYFLDVSGFDKYLFLDNVDAAKVSGKIIYVSDANSIPSGAQVIETINSLDDEPVFVISKINKSNNAPTNTNAIR